MNWDQLRSVLWLRWRLTRNQWARGGGVGAVIAVVVVFFVVTMSVSTFGVALAAGASLLDDATTLALTGIWVALVAVFLLFWLVGLIQDMQRSESIDLQRLMHLPVALGQIFVVNYIASHLTVGVVVFVPAMIGLSIGLAISRTALWLAMIPLALAMVVMISAWTYYLRGWLAALMSNPRRRRAVIMGLTAGFILLAQAPNLYFTVFRGDRPKTTGTVEEQARQREANRAGTQKEVERMLVMQRAVPPFWVSAGAQGLAEGRVLPALLGTLGCLGIGAIGLRRAYLSTLRFYQGESGGKAAARVTTPAVARASGPPIQAGQLLVERRIPGVPEQPAALALATLQSMLRAPEVKMQWGMSFVVTVVLGASMLFRSGAGIPAAAGPFVATGVVAFSLFMLVAFLANQFGLDREGFRALVLSPVERRMILIGKNLACLPAGAISALVLLVIVAVALRLSPLVVLATLFQLAAGLLIAGVGGNLLSILMPYRVQAGSMKPTKMPGLAMLVLVLSQMMFPLVFAPVFIPPLAGFLWQRFGGPPAALVNVLLSIPIAALAAALYWYTLAPLGRLLQRRETKILSVVTAEVE